MIKNTTEYTIFLNILPELEKDEVYFVSLSARNKYLNAEERKKYHLGRTEMFGRTIAGSKEELTQAITEYLPSKLELRKTRKGFDIPEKCLSVYVNINPSSMIKAYFQLKKETENEIYEILRAEQNGKEPNYTGPLMLKRRLLNSIQKSRARKVFIDIDCDTDDMNIVYALSDMLNLEKVEHHAVKTQGGFHFLIKKETLSKNSKLHLIVKDVNKIAELAGGEVVFNKNEMIPVPGTLQANKLVYLYN